MKGVEDNQGLGLSESPIETCPKIPLGRRLLWLKPDYPFTNLLSLDMIGPILVGIAGFS